MFPRKLAAHTIRMGARNICCAFREFGIRKVFLTVGLYAWILVMHFALLLDRVFFPDYKRVRIVNPVFIIGTGRTGSTFLYRLLNSERDYVASEFRNILIPSLTVRALLRPVRRFLVREPDGGHDGNPYDDNAYEVFTEEEGHETTLTTLEEDEMVLSYVMDTQHMSYSTPLGLHPAGFDELVYHDDQPHRLESAAFLKAYFQRQIKYLGRKQIISKAIFGAFRIRTLCEVFPDAKFIYLVRSPLESIPSHMTLHMRTMQKFNPGVSPEGLSRFLMYRYRYNCEALLQFESLCSRAVIDKSRFLEVRYEDLMENLEATMQRIVVFTGIEVSPSLRTRWTRQAAIQASYHPRHFNLSLESLGLSAETIRRDLAPIFEKYGF